MFLAALLSFAQDLWAIPVIERISSFFGCQKPSDPTTKGLNDAKTSIAIYFPLVSGKWSQQLATTAASARSKRSQSRQLQQQEKKEKVRSQETSRVQRLFNIYPKRAVRKVLGERPLQYTGSTEQATSYLSETYVRIPLSPIELHEARTLYDSCCWEAPSDSQMSYLDHPLLA